MSEAAVRISDLPVDERRGTKGMLLFITSELLLFVSLFFSYFYLGHRHAKWPDEPPKFKLALIMLVILLASSAVLHWAEKSLKKGQPGRARAFLGGTVALGILFVLVQAREYATKLKDLKPTQSAYASIFYTITSFHAAHLLVGLLMLLFVLVLPKYEPRKESPHRPLHNVSLYWHFVDAIWVFIVGLLYLLPQLGR